MKSSPETAAYVMYIWSERETHELVSDFCLGIFSPNFCAPTILSQQNLQEI